MTMPATMPINIFRLSMNRFRRFFYAVIQL